MLIFSLYKIASRLIEDKKAKDMFSSLSEMVRAAESKETEAAPAREEESRVADETGETEAPENRTVLPRYASLYEMNSDTFGWISIEGTLLDYPVMYTPRDPQFYLRRDFYGQPLVTGVPFVDASCPENGNFYLIYGHQMNNGTMFGSLDKYASREYRDEHPYIRFDTLYREGTYEVMAAFFAEINDSKDGFAYYRYRDLTDPGVFREYVEGVKQSSVYDTGIDAEYGDELITLSTCSYHTEEGRFVVVAKRIR